MARTSAVTTADVTIVSAYRFGGSSGKKRKVVTATFYDPAATSGGWTIGGTAADIPATAFGLTKIESVTGTMMIYTTSGGAAVRVIPIAPGSSGTDLYTIALINATDANRAAVADMTLATTETALITLIGY